MSSVDDTFELYLVPSDSILLIVISCSPTETSPNSQTCRPFDGTTERELLPLDLVSFDLWGLSHVQSVGGKVYLMILVDTGTSYKHGAYLPDKSNVTTIEVFDIFCAMAQTTTVRVTAV